MTSRESKSIFQFLLRPQSMSLSIHFSSPFFSLAFQIIFWAFYIMQKKNEILYRHWIRVSSAALMFFQFCQASLSEFAGKPPPLTLCLHNQISLTWDDAFINPCFACCVCVLVSSNVHHILITLTAAVTKKYMGMGWRGCCVLGDFQWKIIKIEEI